MVLGFPFALPLGLAALGALIAIYFWRSRFKRYPVSSLMLWRQFAPPREGGARRQRLLPPPLFYLELALLTALAIAALEPRLRRPDAAALLVVFDASASMLAQGDDGLSSQQRAAQALRRLLRQDNYGRIKLLIAAGSEVENGGAMLAARAPERLLQIACHGVSDNLGLALTRAGELASAADDLLVLSDHAPPESLLLRPGMRWIATGQPLANGAITFAERSLNESGRELLLLEVALRGAQVAAIPLRVEALADGAPLFTGAVALNEKGEGRHWLELPPQCGALRLVLPDDALASDNLAILLPRQMEPLPVALQIGDAALRRVLERALRATEQAALQSDAPKLIFSDAALSPSAVTNPRQAGVWRFNFVVPHAAKLHHGPLLADLNDPLLEGLSFEGIAWRVGTNAPPGRALLYAESAPLLTVANDWSGGKSFYLVSSGASDALYRSATWPALIWNLLQGCRAAQPGLTQHNLRVDAPVRLIAPRGAREIQLETPSAALRLAAVGGELLWSPKMPGLYRMLVGGEQWQEFAVNQFAAAESDLSRCCSGEWGARREAEQLRRTHRSFAWLAGVVALLLAVLHQLLLRAPGKPKRTPSERGGAKQ